MSGTPDRERELEGKIVLITGGRRVGRELAWLLADRGASVVMTYHNSRDIISQTISEVESRGGMGLAVQADLSQADKADWAVQSVVERFGRIDALVNMASVYRRTPFERLSSADFDAMVAGNLAAPYFTAVAAGRAMLRQEAIDGIRGRIVNMGDWATERPYKDYLPYLIAKGGLTTMTLALAKELAPWIPVAMIQPAMIEPPPDFTESDKQAVVEQTPLRRIGSPDDVNQLILYLLVRTSFVTGACFRVDGGRFLGTDS
jgi:pteridine reductase